MVLYKNTKVKVRSPAGDIDFFDIVAGVLQSEHISTIPVHNLPKLLLRTSIDLMKENGVTLSKQEGDDAPQ